MKYIGAETKPLSFTRGTVGPAPQTVRACFGTTPKTIVIVVRMRWIETPDDKVRGHDTVPFDAGLTSDVVHSVPGESSFKFLTRHQRNNIVDVR
ncbi:hypothetical protein MRX96_045819 [Rhipicephalus microplus]